MSRIDGLPTEKLAAIDLTIRLVSERNRHPLVPPVLSELRSEVNAELERDRAFGAALARTGLLDMRPAELSPDVLGALVRAAVEATGHVIVSTEKARTE